MLEVKVTAVAVEIVRDISSSSSSTSAATTVVVKEAAAAKVVETPALVVVIVAAAAAVVVAAAKSSSGFYSSSRCYYNINKKYVFSPITKDCLFDRCSRYLLYSDLTNRLTDLRNSLNFRLRISDG